MRRINQTVLQVKDGNNWAYVTCRGMPSGKVITTLKRHTAQPGDDDTLAYFERVCGNREFRVEKRGDK